MSTYSAYHEKEIKEEEKLSKFGTVSGILGAIGTFSIVKGLADSVVDTRNPIVKAGLLAAEITMGILGFSSSYRMSEPFESAYNKMKEAYRKEEDKENEEDE